MFSSGVGGPEVDCVMGRARGDSYFYQGGWMLQEEIVLWQRLGRFFLLLPGGGSMNCVM